MKHLDVASIIVLSFMVPYCTLLFFRLLAMADGVGESVKYYREHATWIDFVKILLNIDGCYYKRCY